MMIIKFVELLQKREINLVVIQEPIDTTNAIGRMMMHVIAAFAQLERDLISERTKAGLQAKRKQGVAIGPPKKLTPEDWVRAVQLRKQGLSCRAITDEINIGKRGKKKLSYSTLQNMRRQLDARELYPYSKKEQPIDEQIDWEET